MEGTNDANVRVRSLVITEADFANLSLLLPHAELQQLLERANVVSSDAVPINIITMNTQVVLFDKSTGKRRLVRVVYPQSANAELGLISVLEPRGMALLGASPGQVIECGAAHSAGDMWVEKVVFQPEDSLRTRLVTKGATIANL